MRILVEPLVVGILLMNPGKKYHQTLYKPFMTMMRTWMTGFMRFITGQELMNCQEFINTLSLFSDNDLSEHKRKMWLKHYKMCQDCNRFFKGFRSSLKLVHYSGSRQCPESILIKNENLIVAYARAKH